MFAHFTSTPAKRSADALEGQADAPNPKKLKLKVNSRLETVETGLTPFGASQKEEPAEEIKLDLTTVAVTVPRAPQTEETVAMVAVAIPNAPPSPQSPPYEPLTQVSLPLPSGNVDHERCSENSMDGDVGDDRDGDVSDANGKAEEQVQIMSNSAQEDFGEEQSEESGNSGGGTSEEYSEADEESGDEDSDDTSGEADEEDGEDAGEADEEDGEDAGEADEEADEESGDDDTAGEDGEDAGEDEVHDDDEAYNPAEDSSQSEIEEEYELQEGWARIYVKLSANLHNFAFVRFIQSKLDTRYAEARKDRLRGKINDTLKLVEEGLEHLKDQLLEAYLNEEL